ncbi:unnamed protein product [Didymodactylos carnosus]|uniref:NHL repeat-containing protein n=1 Tax=Didymodactylos carnosus TaxID=1234261 RepID=A0A814K9G9_9BILA|nr:unnamed protein product [Didymodactylos carnosus]CAF3819217.1 unnamed protein product [Didymodactylos carnosus]
MRSGGSCYNPESYKCLNGTVCANDRVCAEKCVTNNFQVCIDNGTYRDIFIVYLNRDLSDDLIDRDITEPPTKSIPLTAGQEVQLEFLQNELMYITLLPYYYSSRKMVLTFAILCLEGGHTGVDFNHGNIFAGYWCSLPFFVTWIATYANGCTCSNCCTTSRAATTHTLVEQIISSIFSIVLIVLDAKFINNPHEFETSAVPTISSEATWSTTGETVAGGYNSGDQLNQLHSPEDIFVDDQNSIYVADNGNDRIVKWTSDAIQGEIVADNSNQLYSPNAVFVDKQGNLYVSDGVNHLIQKFSNKSTNASTVVGKYQFDTCYGLFVDESGNIYLSDYLNHIVLKFIVGANTGDIVAGREAIHIWTLS